MWSISSAITPWVWEGGAPRRACPATCRNPRIRRAVCCRVGPLFLSGFLLEFRIVEPLSELVVCAFLLVEGMDHSGLHTQPEATPRRPDRRPKPVAGEDSKHRNDTSQSPLPCDGAIRYSGLQGDADCCDAEDDYSIAQAGSRVAVVVEFADDQIAKAARTGLIIASTTR